jgi:enoyl-CoA hydratase/carnithine racemase
VNRVVPAAGLRIASLELASQISSASADTIAIGKRAFYDQIAMDERSAYECAREVMTQNALHDDAGEGIAAFLSKRAPVWRS